jgi:hypothetical protein
MNKQQNPLGIRVGDTVEIFFDHEPSRGSFNAKVTEVVDRTMMGSDAHISYQPDEMSRDLEAEALGIPYGCSVSHVRAIVARAPYKCDVYRSPLNIFRQTAEEKEVRRVEEGRPEDYWPGYYSVGGVRISYESMGALVELALAMAKDTLDRPYSLERFHTLWERDGFRGKVTVPTVPELGDVYAHEELQEMYVAVNWKVFKHYVLANRHRLLLSQKEMEKAGAAFSKAMWASEEESNDYDVEYEARSQHDDNGQRDDFSYADDYDYFEHHPMNR